jgi:flavin prenyltransferase
MPSTFDLPTVLPLTPPVVLGITGASGSIIGLHLLKALLLAEQPVQLVCTDKGVQVMAYETGFNLFEKPSQADRINHLLNYLNLPASSEMKALVQLESNKNIGASCASGSYKTKAMVVAPCSMGTVAKIRHGLADNLLTRSADVTIKEARPLIIMPRETPLSTLHLENLLGLSRMGVRIVPPMLSFYATEFDSVEGQISYSIGKVLDLLGLDHTLYTRWKGMHPKSVELPQVHQNSKQ